mgnify:CR=1 FL=1
MSTLTSIPRELRDHILGYVIQTNTNDAPDINQTFEDLVQDRKVFTNPSLNSWCTTVLYQPETTIANTTSILFTNRQLRNETLENIKRLNANVCELDVIILDEILPLVTWTHVPIFATSYDKVNVTYRISGVYDDQKEVGWIEEGTRVDGPYTKYGLYKRFRGGNGAGPAIGWQLYSILERFIKAGPTGEGSDKHAHSHITVKTIDINVQTPPGVDPSLFRHARSGGYSDRDDSVLDPKHLATFITQNISCLLRSEDHEWFRYGSVLFEHVDHVVIKCDGNLISELDVAECLSDAAGFREHHLSQEALAVYKETTWKARKQRGLKVLED